jgi:hypothetical protein
VAVLATASACVPPAPRDRVSGARRAPGIVRDSDALVHAGFPGPWRWRTVYAAPDRYAWSVETTGEPTHYLFDGRTARAFVGSALASEDSSPGAALRSHVRFMSVLFLDALDAPGVRVREVPPADGPAGAVMAFEAVFGDPEERYVVWLDAERRAAAVEGRVALPPFGHPLVRVVASDHRTIRGVAVPFRLVWTADGKPLADERVRAACLLRTPPPAAAFTRPGALPACD